MEKSDLSGKCAGRVVGTSMGNLFVELKQEQNRVMGVVHFKDIQHGLFVYHSVGEISYKIQLHLTPQKRSDGVTLTPAKVIASVQPDGSLTGKWESDEGEAGTFVLWRRDQIGGETAAERGITDTRPPVIVSFDPPRLIFKGSRRECEMPTCSVDFDVLKKVFGYLTKAATRPRGLGCLPFKPRSHLPVQILTKCNTLFAKWESISGACTPSD